MSSSYDHQVTIILDCFLGSKLLKGIYLNYLKHRDDCKYLQILLYAYCGRISSTNIHQFNKIPKQLLKNREFVRGLLKKKGSMIQYLDESYRMDQELALIAVNNCSRAFSFIGEELKGERELILAFFNSNDMAMGDTTFSEEIYATTLWTDHYALDQEVLLAAVRYFPSVYECIEPSLMKNRDFVMKAVSLNGMAVLYACNELKSDREVMLQAILSDPSLLLRSKYSNDPHFISEYVKKSRYPKILKYAHSSIRKNRNIVLESVKKNVSEFQYADKCLRGYDREIVLHAVQKDGDLLELVALPLSDDKDIVRTAIQQRPLSLRFASARFRNDISIVELAVSKNRHALIHASKQLQDTLLVEEEPEEEGNEWSVAHCSYDYWNEKISHAHNNVQLQRKYALEAVRNGISLDHFHYDDDRIHGDRELVLEAVKKNERNLSNVKLWSWDLNYSFMRQSIRSNKRCLLLTRDNLLLDREFILETCILYSIYDLEANDCLY